MICGTICPDDSFIRQVKRKILIFIEPENISPRSARAEVKKARTKSIGFESERTMSNCVAPWLCSVVIKSSAERGCDRFWRFRQTGKKIRTVGSATIFIFQKPGTIREVGIAKETIDVRNGSRFITNVVQIPSGICIGIIVYRDCINLDRFLKKIFKPFASWIKFRNTRFSHIVRPGIDAHITSPVPPEKSPMGKVKLITSR